MYHTWMFMSWYWHLLITCYIGQIPYLLWSCFLLICKIESIILIPQDFHSIIYKWQLYKVRWKFLKLWLSSSLLFLCSAILVGQYVISSPSIHQEKISNWLIVSPLHSKIIPSWLHVSSHFSHLFNKQYLGPPWWRSGWESACRCRGHGFEPWSGRIPHAAEQLRPWATITEPARLEPVLHNKRGRYSERPAHRDEEWPPLATTRESPRTETKTQHSHKWMNK